MIITNCETIEEYIASLKHCALDNDLYVVKDPECNFAYASEEVVKSFGFTSLSSIEGRSVYEIQSQVVELAPYLDSRDLKLVSDLNSSTMLVNFHSNPLTGLIIHEGASIFSRENKLIGLLIRFSRVERPLLWSNFIFKHYGNSGRNPGPSLLKTEGSDNINLSEREQKVLFLLSLNYDTRQIADILSKVEGKPITANLIRNNINQQLYIKFGVNTVTELLERYSMLELNKLLPPAFDQQFATLV